MRYFMLSLVALLLTGCSAGMKSNFSCEKIGGIEGCSSMTDVRSAMDRGEFSSQGHVIKGEASHASLTSMPNFIPLPRRNREGAPLRTQEHVQKVTIFPFTTPDGYYVDTTDMYIADDSQWTGRPVQAIRKD
ncbi:type IV conjugative transfer system lipoprotein TraV [Photobacterium indicum]|uniref:type IV conjugative transfer system lipoprotein TraV n=1 Tax=Photobacterium indicum TaxID=81447 RepID=UPI003D0A9223